MNWTEAHITINGHHCTDAESATIRCALESMASSLFHDGLGDDEHGKAMTASYLRNVATLRVKLGVTK